MRNARLDLALDLWLLQILITLVSMWLLVNIDNMFGHVILVIVVALLFWTDFMSFIWWLFSFIRWLVELNLFVLSTNQIIRIDFFLINVRDKLKLTILIFLLLNDQLVLFVIESQNIIKSVHWLFAFIDLNNNFILDVILFRIVFMLFLWSFFLFMWIFY